MSITYSHPGGVSGRAVGQRRRKAGKTERVWHEPLATCCVVGSVGQADLAEEGNNYGLINISFRTRARRS